jgi:hypothetical protein
MKSPKGQNTPFGPTYPRVKDSHDVSEKVEANVQQQGTSAQDLEIKPQKSSLQ